jgi:hypothetical protein
MSDAERWLVAKEDEKGGDGGEGTSKANESSSLEGTVNEMRDKLGDARPYRRAGTRNGQVCDLTGMLSTTQAVSTAPQSYTTGPVSRISSYGDLRGRESVSPPFIPPSAIRAENPQSRLPYPTGDYTSPSGSVVVGQGALSPPQSPPTSNLDPLRLPAVALAQCALDPNPLAAFLHPPRHLQRLLLLVCHRRGRDSRWRPLRNSLHAQGRRVLARYHANVTRSHWENPS